MNSPLRIDSTLLIIAVTAVTTIAGGVLGVMTAAATWDHSIVIGGSLAGASAGLIVGFVNAWHGSAISRSPGRSSSAALWGIIPAGLIGLSVAPVVTGAVGGVLGQLGGGILTGLLLGPLLGIAGWELAFWGDLLAGRIPLRS